MRTKMAFAKLSCAEISVLQQGRGATSWLQTRKGSGSMLNYPMRKLFSIFSIPESGEYLSSFATVCLPTVLSGMVQYKNLEGETPRYHGWLFNSSWGG